MDQGMLGTRAISVPKFTDLYHRLESKKATTFETKDERERLGIPTFPDFDDLSKKLLSHEVLVVDTRKIVELSIQSVVFLQQTLAVHFNTKRNQPCLIKTNQVLQAYLNRPDPDEKWQKIFQSIQDETKATSTRWQRLLDDFPQIPLPDDIRDKKKQLEYQQDCAARAFLMQYAERLYTLYRATQPAGKLHVNFDPIMCSILQSISDGMSLCEAQDAHLDWRLLGKAVGHISLANISSQPCAIGLYLHSPATIKFVRNFSEQYYPAYLREFAAAPSIHNEEKFMKDNVGSSFNSENEKAAFVWDFIVSEAMKKAGLRPWQCVNLEIMPWEVVIATADMVHFGSRFPNCKIKISESKQKSKKSVHFRLHHYLGSRDILKSVEEGRSAFNDCAFNPDNEDASEMVQSAMAGATVVSKQFQNYTFDLRANPDMAPALRMMGSIPSDVERFSEFV